MAAVIEAVEGAPFPDVVARELTVPLGLADTLPLDPNVSMPACTLFYELRDGKPTAIASDPGGRIGGSGYASTARDLVIMGHAIVQTDFVSKENRVELLRDERTTGGKPTFFGLGWHLGRSEEWGFFYGNSGGGDGIAASLLVIPKYGVTVAVLANLTSAPSWQMTQGTAEVFVDAIRSARAER